jgi:aryl-alcohol dehydrogenase-like predicted oxidoreductase
MDMGPGRTGLSRSRIRTAVEESLARLQTDHIDLYQSHADDAATPLAETLAAYAELIAEGKVRAIGASNYSAPRLAEALALSTSRGLPRYETLQPLYNLVDRQPFEAELEPLCLRENIGVINFYGLASGFLTGKYRSEADLGKSPRGSRVKSYMTPRGMRILAALDEVAQTLNATPAQVALAWQMARPAITAPIASATSLVQLEELAQAARLRLSAQAIATLDAASAPDAPA